MVVLSRAIIALASVFFFGTTVKATPTHSCRTTENSPLLSDCQIALSKWQDDVYGGQACVRDNRTPLAEHGRCLIWGYNIDLNPKNPNVPARNDYCFTKSLVLQTLKYLTWQCGLPLSASASPNGNPDIRIEGEYKFDSVDGVDTKRYRSIKVVDVNYEELEQWADGSLVSPDDWELRAYDWDHRGRIFSGRPFETPAPLPKVTVAPRVRETVAAAMQAAEKAADEPAPAKPADVPA